ncbi:MAG: hypothetical protein OSJ73_27030 [Lachnospiraceae bacterium]|nr:hypothetical protein [Lachnospiraceae bacterium]
MNKDRKTAENAAFLFPSYSHRREGKATAQQCRVLEFCGLGIAFLKIARLQKL